MFESNYLSPEMFNDNNLTSIDNYKKLNVFSFGIIILRMYLLLDEI